MGAKATLGMGMDPAPLPAPWTSRVQLEEERRPVDPPCPLGRGKMPHGPSVSIGRRRNAPQTPHVHWDPPRLWGRKRDAPQTIHVHWEEERFPMDPPCPVGGGVILHGPRMSTGTLFVHGGEDEMPRVPSMSMGEKERCPMDPHISSGRKKDCDACVALSAAPCPHVCTVTVGLHRKV